MPRVINQRYELKEELGKGAHGRIYSGKDRVSKIPIAVKVVRALQIYYNIDGQDKQEQEQVYPRDLPHEGYEQG